MDNKTNTPDTHSSELLHKALSPARLNGLNLRNRLIKAATFEGKSPGGQPGEELRRFHERLGRGGIGMTTLGYCAAEADGRIHSDMIYMDEYLRPWLTDFISSVQQTGARVAGQLSHCGNFSKNKALRGKRPLGPSFGLNMMGLASGLPFAGSLTIPQIRQRVQVFADAARFMTSVGFDAIEIHFGHGYGLSQFISPITNKRKDAYGGSLSNRMRFPLEVLAAVRAAVGDDFPLLGKISMSDGVRNGISYDDAVEIAALLDQGGIDAIVCSGGTSSMNPMLLFRGDSIAKGLIEQEQNPLMKVGLRLFASSMFRNYPYQDLYFLEQAKRIRARVSCNVCYIGGVCSNDNIRTVMAEGFDFMQLGRGLLFDPDFANHAGAEPDYRNACTHCNQCATLIEAPGGIRCPLSPAEEPLR